MNQFIKQSRHYLAALIVAGASSSFTQVSASESVDWPDEGWTVISSEKSYATLLDDLHQAVADVGMAVVTEAGPTEAAAERGEIIPGNRVVGVFRNDFAVAIIRESVPAMIEAPLRFYVTEDSSDSATLSWKIPSHVFAPYINQKTPTLADQAQALDALFQQIGESAVSP
ncbi:DUF302 domain-containing protein [Halomonas qaidamensis]|uniref:DUF302 domain-containing protein n=1 Tax=Halomonas qaidamensis TaxID=2866211 RepID=A0ABY6JV22_9GAMM|nr:DUF302 domain-containing protein [Halomonas qaidamensis]UYV20072.1 DUF302 domain-containing protein [Halomonas qaidamensis]